MSVNYGVLRGSIIDAIPYQKGADHYQIEVQADEIYRIAVDVYSQFAGEKAHFPADGNTKLDTDRMVMYYKDENYTNPVTTKILTLNKGFTPKANMDHSLCLDYLSFNPPLFPVNSMGVVKPKSDNSPGEDLNDDIDPVVQQAKNNPNAEVFAFGSGWDDNAPGNHPKTPAYFHPNPSVGVHDIHMNQGDTGQQEKNNGRNRMVHFFSILRIPISG